MRGVHMGHLVQPQTHLQNLWIFEEAQHLFNAQCHHLEPQDAWRSQQAMHLCHNFQNRLFSAQVHIVTLLLMSHCLHQVELPLTEAQGHQVELPLTEAQGHQVELPLTEAQGHQVELHFTGAQWHQVGKHHRLEDITSTVHIILKQWWRLLLCPQLQWAP